MTVVSSMPRTVACPRCGSEIPPTIKVCWRCGFWTASLHESCPICGGPVGHGRHYGPRGLAYYCRCGFAATTRRELNRHLEAVK